MYPKARQSERQCPCPAQKAMQLCLWQRASVYLSIYQTCKHNALAIFVLDGVLAGMGVQLLDAADRVVLLPKRPDPCKAELQLPQLLQQVLVSWVCQGFIASMIEIECQGSITPIHTPQDQTVLVSHAFLVWVCQGFSTSMTEIERQVLTICILTFLKITKFLHPRVTPSVYNVGASWRSEVGWKYLALAAIPVMIIIILTRFLSHRCIGSRCCTPHGHLRAG